MMITSSFSSHARYRCHHSANYLLSPVVYHHIYSYMPTAPTPIPTHVCSSRSAPDSHDIIVSRAATLLILCSRLLVRVRYGPAARTRTWTRLARIDLPTYVVPPPCVRFIIAAPSPRACWRPVTTVAVSRAPDLAPPNPRPSLLRIPSSHWRLRILLTWHPHIDPSLWLMPLHSPLSSVIGTISQF